MSLTHEFYELHEMLKLEIHVQEAGENGRDVITLAHSGDPTPIEVCYAARIRRSVIAIARSSKAATKYEKGSLSTKPMVPQSGVGQAAIRAPS